MTFGKCKHKKATCVGCGKKLDIDDIKYMAFHKARREFEEKVLYDRILKAKREFLEFIMLKQEDDGLDNLNEILKEVGLFTTKTQVKNKDQI